MASGSPAVFLDRDGVLIVDKDYLKEVEQVELIPGTLEGLKCLQDAGFLLFIVTNQSGVGRGYYTMNDVEKVHAYLLRRFDQAGIRIQKIYVAPEAPDQPSRGRKPSPQFLLDARDEFGLDLANSYLIGDKASDLECGWNAQVRKCILVRTGKGAEVERKKECPLERAVVVDSISEACQWIAQNSPKP